MLQAGITRPRKTRVSDAISAQWSLIVMGISCVSNGFTGVATAIWLSNFSP
jgi:hypothetical protein